MCDSVFVITHELDTLGQVDRLTKTRVRKELEDLANSTDPASLGTYKQSMGVFTYDVGESQAAL